MFVRRITSHCGKRCTMKRSKGQKVFNVFNIFFLLVGCAIFLVPYIIVVSSSITDEITLIANGYSIIPKNITFYAYEFMFSKNLPIVQSMLNTLFLVAGSLVLCTLTCILYAYALQHSALKGRKFFKIYIRPP